MIDVNVDSVEEIINHTHLYSIILRILDNENGFLTKECLYERLKQRVKNIFPNLRSDYFDMRYPKSGGNIFEKKFYFSLLYLGERIYRFIEKKGTKKNSEFKISSIGKEFLKTPEGKSDFIDYKDIEQFLQAKYPSIWDQSLSNPKNKKSKDLRNNKDTNIVETMMEVQEEEISWENMYREHTIAMGQKILNRIYQLEPRAVEKLVGHLLEHMGYGDACYTDVVGDGGIDIILNKDVLGLDKVLVQVKRYQQEKKISSSDIRNFMGSLTDYNMQNGIFVTTSDFTKDARDLALKHNIIPINGKKLAELMIRESLGVEEDQKYILYAFNEDFFRRFEQDSEIY